MQSNPLILTSVAVALLWAIHARTQQSVSTPPEAEGFAGALLLDPLTWEVIGPAHDRSLYADLNTPKQIEARRLAVLANENPDEYLKLFPKTLEELQHEQEGALAMRRPKTREEHLLELTPEQLAEEQNAMFAILQPREFYAEYLQQKELERQQEELERQQAELERLQAEQEAAARAAETEVQLPVPVEP